MQFSQPEWNTPEGAALRDAAESLAGKDERALMDALRDATAQERAEGRLDEAGMDEIVRTLSPMLSAAQREKMARILSQLRG